MTPPTFRAHPAELRSLANALDRLCMLLRDERAALPTDDAAYLNGVAALDEVIRLETAPMLIRRIAERRP